MSVTDKITAHFNELERGSIEVEEWDMTIYWSAYTVAERNKLMKFADRDGGMGLLVRALIMKAEDEQGDKIFTLEDKKVLMSKADPDVIGKVVEAMLGKEASLEDMELD